jgi:choline dehydrogenase
VVYDDIIVGGGSAGAVLAARLSGERARRVVLIDAGPDYATLELTPTDLRDCWRMSFREHDWGLTAEAVPGRAIAYPRGRVIGGSSAVNATIALRGVPADYDEWAALGNDGAGRRCCRIFVAWRTTRREPMSCTGAAVRSRFGAGAQTS